MNILDLFSGIGGFSLGLERAGFKTVAMCEIEDYPRQVLKKHWPNVPIYKDVRKLTRQRLEQDGITNIRLICGGYPCQPFSTAGKREGHEDDRHLWPEMYRIIKAVRPQWVIAENVAGHISMGLDTVLSDLEAANYSWNAFVIPACAVDAPHRRDRIWIVANIGSAADNKQRPVCENRDFLGEKSQNNIVNFWGQYHRTFKLIIQNRTNDAIDYIFCRTNDGVSKRVDRLKGLGNAVVPQIPEIIGRAIIESMGK